MRTVPAQELQGGLGKRAAAAAAATAAAVVAAAAGDDLRLQLVNKGHPERKREEAARREVVLLKPRGCSSPANCHVL